MVQTLRFHIVRPDTVTVGSLSEFPWLLYCLACWPSLIYFCWGLKFMEVCITREIVRSLRCRRKPFSELLTAQVDNRLPPSSVGDTKDSAQEFQKKLSLKVFIKVVIYCQCDPICSCGRMASWENVQILSDEESVAPASKVVAPSRPREPRKTKRRRFLEVNAKASKFSIKSLRHTVASQCGCSCDCFGPFRTNLFDRLTHLREKLASLSKLDSDEFVGSLDSWEHLGA